MSQTLADQADFSFFSSMVPTGDTHSEIGRHGNVIIALELSLTGWSRLDNRHRLIARRDRTVLAASHFVDGFLADFGGIRMERGKLLVESPRAEKILDEALAPRGNEVVVQEWHSPDRDATCIARSTPFDEDSVCLSLQPVTSDAPVSPPDLAALLGLTRSESVIAQSMFQGLTPQQIASNLRISIHTVRAHLRHCYAKLGVCCREEFLHKLQPYLLL